MNSNRSFVFVLILSVLVPQLLACNSTDDQKPVDEMPEEEATFVGLAACADCHSLETRLWQGSHHDLAMQEVSQRTVLGDFDDAEVTYNEITSRFFNRDGKYYVNTDGPDGEMRDFEIAFVFGVEPLQQYLIAFPDGRHQALSLCWDTRPVEEGGQRWFHLYPDEEIDHTDPLHWTGIQQNWNYMCAECHSTNLIKGYVPEEDRYETTWSEMDISCEACHGPGSRHVDWANAAAIGRDTPYDNGDFGLEIRLKDPGRGTWLVNPETGKGMRLAPLPAVSEMDTCARCHSRRSVVSDDYKFGRPIMDTHRPALLESNLYHADGQILDEVYVYGSYLQSRMNHQGVTCSDCHDPHSLDLVFPGDSVCRRCHAQATFESKSHHFHETGKPGSACVDCHMPPKNYMVVDPRHDHSLRIPRPDLSVEMETPNACNDCHSDKTAQWSVDWVTKWYGPDAPKGLLDTEALHAARSGSPDAERLLQQLIDDPEKPAIVRATGLAELERYLTQASVGSVERSLVDVDPLMRMGALRAARSVPAQDRIRMAFPLLEDPVRAVRIEAARLLVEVSGESMTQDQRSRLSGALEEYRQSQLVDSDRPEANLNLGWLASRLGDLGEAEFYYQTAIKRDPTFVPAYVNLGDLYRMQGRDAEGEMLFRSALTQFPESPDLIHSLGLNLVRLGRVDEAVELFERAVELQPDHPRYSFVYAVALYDSGQRQRALDILEEAHDRMPADLELLSTLVGYYRQEGNLEKTLYYAKELLALVPGDSGLQQLVRQLESQ